MKYNNIKIKKYNLINKHKIIIEHKNKTKNTK